ncbi:hypothetical protein IJ670_08125 [bacterium]|nr:hypothetical protein [bacterium]
MNRRDLIKSGIIAAGALALGGCKEQVTVKSLEDYKDIIPKQTATFEFSVPLPLTYEVIDEIVEINKKHKKSQITTFYNSIPVPFSPFNQLIQIDRGSNPSIKSYEQYMSYVDYAQERGFRYCHLMNSTKSLSKEDFESIKKPFYHVLDILKDHNVKEIKITNPQVATWVYEYNPEFIFSSSTATGYNSMMQYRNLFNIFPNYKLIDMCIDQNQNFPFLKMLRKEYPNVKIEVMVNEPCIKGCPARVSHEGETFFCIYNCSAPRVRDGHIAAFFKTSAIYPWNLEYYSAIGINNFKFLPEHNPGLRANFNNLALLKNYLNCVENGIGDMTANEFFTNMYSSSTEIQMNKDIKLSHVLPHFPAIEHFIKHGDKCMTSCGVDCKYCHNCAHKIEQMLDITT